MKLLVLGGTGLLGSHVVAEAVRRGHETSALSRGIAEKTPRLLSGVRWIAGDVHGPQSALRDAFAGQDAVVYALGLDERELRNKPAYAALRADHVDVCLAALRTARAAGVRRFVVLGSYFTHFDRTLPDLRLADRHPYIRSRREQLEAVLAESRDGIATYVLEIPYVIGSLPGKIPPWTLYFDLLAGKKRPLFFARGGTAAVTARQVGEAAIGALERGTAGTAYPLGGMNVTWPDLAARFRAILGVTGKTRNLPESAFALFGLLDGIVLGLRGKQRGLSLGRFAAFQYLEAYVDPEPSMRSLGYGHDDYGVALADLVEEWKRTREMTRR